MPLPRRLLPLPQTTLSVSVSAPSCIVTTLESKASRARSRTNLHNSESIDHSNSARPGFAAVTPWSGSTRLFAPGSPSLSNGSISASPGQTKAGQVRELGLCQRREFPNERFQSLPGWTKADPWTSRLRAHGPHISVPTLPLYRFSNIIPRWRFEPLPTVSLPMKMHRRRYSKARPSSLCSTIP